MEEKYKLLDLIHHDASMGAHTIDVLLKNLEDKDNKITPYLKAIKGKYATFEKEAKKILKSLNLDSKDPGLMAKIGSSMGIAKEVKDDNSDSTIADMMIQGVNMGLVKIEKGLKDYASELDSKHKKLAKDFLEFQHSVIDNLKEYL